MPGDLPPRAAQALDRLLAGNRRFVQGHPELRDHRARRLEVASAQSPFATVVGCSDSRASPEIVFDAGLGELFVVRVAGAVPGPLEAESVSFGVQVLGTPLVLVMGHTGCGAVAAAADWILGGGEAPGNLGRTLGTLRPAVERACRHASGSSAELYVRAVQCSVEDAVRRLGSLEALASSEVAIMGAVYSLESGTVTLLDSEGA